MIALNSRIEASDPHINAMLNCKFRDLEIQIFTLNLEIGVPKLYIFRLNLEISAPGLYIFTLTWKWGPLDNYFHAINLDNLGP